MKEINTENLTPKKGLPAVLLRFSESRVEMSAAGKWNSKTESFEKRNTPALNLREEQDYLGKGHFALTVHPTFQIL